MRNSARFAMLAGAVGSIALMIHAGRSSPFLIWILIGGWVAAPFVLFALAESASAQWPSAVRSTLHGVMIVSAIASLVIYAASAFGPSRLKPAFYFVLIPPVSVAVTAAAVAVAGFVARRR